MVANKILYNIHNISNTNNIQHNTQYTQYNKTEMPISSKKVPTIKTEESLILTVKTFVEEEI